MLVLSNMVAEWRVSWKVCVYPTGKVFLTKPVQRTLNSPFVTDCGYGRSVVVAPDQSTVISRTVLTGVVALLTV